MPRLPRGRGSQQSVVSPPAACVGVLPDERARRDGKILAMDTTRTKAVAIASAGCLVVGALACGREVVGVSPMGSAPAVAVVAAEPEVAPATAVHVEPAHGGTVVLAGTYPVEVVPHQSGQVYAYVLGDAPPPPDGTELSVVVPVTGGVRTVELTWAAGETRWEGRVRRAEIVPGPIDVVLVTGGSRWVGHVATIVVLPAIVVAPVAVVPARPAVIVVEHDRGKHRKRRKHRGHGDVRIRVH